MAGRQSSGSGPAPLTAQHIFYAWPIPPLSRTLVSLVVSVASSIIGPHIPVRVRTPRPRLHRRFLPVPIGRVASLAPRATSLATEFRLFTHSTAPVSSPRNRSTWRRINLRATLRCPGPRREHDPGPGLQTRRLDPGEERDRRRGRGHERRDPAAGRHAGPRPVCCRMTAAADPRCANGTRLRNPRDA